MITEAYTCGAFYHPDEDAQYFDLIFGILRQPVNCTVCAQPTHMSFHRETADPIICYDCSVQEGNNERNSK
jgi:hypothetical protein